jgi:hypothetical protein
MLASARIKQTLIRPRADGVLKEGLPRFQLNFEMGPSPTETVLLVAVVKSRLNFPVSKCEMQKLIEETLTLMPTKALFSSD